RRHANVPVSRTRIATNRVMCLTLLSEFGREPSWPFDAESTLILADRRSRTRCSPFALDHNSGLAFVRMLNASQFRQPAPPYLLMNLGHFAAYRRPPISQRLKG